MKAFAAAVEETAATPGVKVVLVTGRGEAFIAGADLEVVANTSTREDGIRLAEIMGDALRQLENLPVISIAVINGPARGGGSEVAAACDLRVMAQEADIAFVHAQLGLSPGWGGARRLLGLVGYSAAIELLVSARRISASEALRIGLVNQVVPGKDLENHSLELARGIAANDREAVSRIKALLRLGQTLSPDEFFDLERGLFVDLWDRDARRDRFGRLRKRGRNKP